MIIETENSNFTVPADPELRRKIRDAVAEASNLMTMLEACREKLKEHKKAACDELEVPKKIFNKMVKAYHKQDYPITQQENEVFELFYENVMEDKSSG